MSDVKPVYVAELYAKDDACGVIDCLRFDADTPSAAKRRVRNWIATLPGMAGSSYIRLRHGSTVVFEKSVPELLGSETPAPETLLASSDEPLGSRSAGVDAHCPKLLQPLLAGLEFARSALTPH